MKVVGLIGEPASGKSTVMRAVLSGLDSTYTSFKYRLVVGRQYPRNLYVLGIYDDRNVFGGTDRLSMAVQPDAIRFLSKVPPCSTVLFEGDRLTRAGFLQAAAAAGNLKLFLLEASPDEKKRRHKDRNDTQPPQFQRSRATLVANIAAHFPVERLRNERPANIESCAALIRAALSVLSNSK